MITDKKFLMDVGMKDLPFPMKVASKVNPDGQLTVGSVSVNARIMQEFEVHWIDKFMQVLHSHRGRIETNSVKKNVFDYIKELNASTVLINYDYPFFVEKLTPVSKEKCLVRYKCTYSAKASSLNEESKIQFRISIPCVTTYPGSIPEHPAGLFGQLSVITLCVESKQDIYPEDLVAIVDKHALAPVYSFLTDEDHEYIIKKIHSEKKSSIILTDEVKDELSRNRNISWYSVSCANFAMIHSYSTVIETEKSMWVPMSGYEENDDI
jgi:GTP cyclohydrolase I